MRQEIMEDLSPIDDLEVGKDYTLQPKTEKIKVLEVFKHERPEYGGVVYLIEKENGKQSLVYWKKGEGLK